MSIRIKTTPAANIPELDRSLDDQKLLERAFIDAVAAMARYAVVGRHLFHATMMLDEIREEFEKRTDRP